MAAILFACHFWLEFEVRSNAQRASQTMTRQQRSIMNSEPCDELLPSQCQIRKKGREMEKRSQQVRNWKRDGLTRRACQMVTRSENNMLRWSKRVWEKAAYEIRRVCRLGRAFALFRLSCDCSKWRSMNFRRVGKEKQQLQHGQAVWLRCSGSCPERPG